MQYEYKPQSIFCPAETDVFLILIIELANDCRQSSVFNPVFVRDFTLLHFCDGIHIVVIVLNRVSCSSLARFCWVG